MKFYISAVFILTIFSTMISASSNDDSQKESSFRVSDTRRMSQQQPSTSSATPKSKERVDKNLTPFQYQISPERLLALEQEQLRFRKQKEAERNRKEREYAIRYGSSRRDFDAYEQEPSFEHTYAEERTRTGSPDIRLIGHDQSEITKKSAYGYRSKKWRDKSSKPTSPLKKPTRVPYFKDDILAIEAMPEDIIEERIEVRRPQISMAELEIRLLDELENEAGTSSSEEE